MLIKERHPNEVISQLEERIRKEPRNRKNLERQLMNVRAGSKAEETAAYFIEFEYKNSDNWAIIHDLRIEHKGRVAQIDHLLLNRWLDVYILESKNFSTSLRITEHGEFERFISDDNSWEAIESPLHQNTRHISVLQEFLADNNLLPRRLGMQLKPVYNQIVLISGKGTITRPPPDKFDTSHVVKSDTFRSVIDKDIKALGTMGNIRSLAQMISQDALKALANGIVALHKPNRYSGGAPAPAASVPSPIPSARIEPVLETPPAAPVAPLPVACVPDITCKDCKQHNLEIAYGKFGYYWKCLDACGGNTKLQLPGPGRLRKAGLQFFHVKPDGSETLFFQNTK